MPVSKAGFRNKPRLFYPFFLFKLDAQEMVQQHHACMYPLLPTMKHVNADIMEQAVRELWEIYHDDVGTLAEQFVWMQVFLERTTTIKLVQKKQIKERLNMFEQLFEESPMIQKMRKRYRIQGRQEGRQEGIQVLQDLLVDSVQARYPNLAGLARQQAGHFDKLDVLKLLIQQVMIAPNANTVRGLLEAGTEMKRGE
jgi:hypothetical protein